MSAPQSLGLDVEILGRLSRDRLVRVLEDAPGAKDLIIDGDLMKMLDRIAGATLLRWDWNTIGKDSFHDQPFIERKNIGCLA